MIAVDKQESKNPNSPQSDLVQGFREALEDVVKIVEKVSHLCLSLDDLVTLCKLALEHDVQLRMLMNTVLSKGK